MWPIIYRILVPYVLVFVLFFLLAIFEFKAYKKRKQKTKGRDNYNKYKAYIIFYTTLSILGFSLAVYDSFDLIKKDFVTYQGIYDGCYRGRELYMREMEFWVDDEKITLYTFRETANKLKEGTEYKVTSGKRTGMIIAVEEVK